MPSDTWRFSIKFTFAKFSEFAGATCVGNDREFKTEDVLKI